MTTGKNLIKALALTLSLLLLFSFTSCGGRDKSDKYDGLFSDDEIEWDAEHEYATYAVVVASNVSAAVYDAACHIAEKLEENTGAYAECFYAHEEIPKGEDVCRILVGNVGFEETGKYLRAFRSEDVGYKYHDRCVYIGGITEEALLSSIERFMQDVVLYADREFFMNDGTELFLCGEYSINEIKLAGFSLGEYTLVYPKGEDKLRDAAKDFSAKMLEKTGYLLPICNDAELTAQSRVILIGDCDAFEENKITPEFDRVKIVGFDAGVMIASEQSLAIRIALDRLASELLAEEDDGCVDFAIDEPIEISFESMDVSLLSFRADAFALSRADMISIVEEVRESYPDIVRFERVSQDSVESLLYNFDDKYALVALSSDTYHMIRKDRYECEVSTADGLDTVKYSHVSQSTELTILEMENASDEMLKDLRSALQGGAALVFSDTELSGIDGIRSASALFDASNTSDIDMPYFAGETLSPTAYTVTESMGLTYSYTALKIISFN